jgi:predicted phosphodiesterase
VKIHVLSDLHIDHAPFEIEKDLEYDVLVVAGDVCDNNPGRAIDWLTRVGKPAIFVLGNHDYWSNEGYGRTKLEDMVDVRDRIDEFKRLAVGTNIHVLENDAVEIGDVRFVGCTLWTNFGGPHEHLIKYARRAINDWSSIGATRWYESDENWEWLREKCIRFNLPEPDARGQHLFHPLIAWKIHEDSLKQIEGELRKTGPWARTVMVTHMSPTLRSLTSTNSVTREALDSRSWHDRLDVRWDTHHVYNVAAYASDLDSFIRRNNQCIDLWIHGHLHRRVDTAVTGVRVLANPRGYYTNDSAGFDAHLVLDLDLPATTSAMTALQPGIDSAIDRMTPFVAELRALALYVGHVDQVIQQAVREAINSRLEKLHTEAAAIAVRINDNVYAKSVMHSDSIDFPVLGLHGIRTPSIYDFDYRRDPEETPWTIEDAIRVADEFLAALSLVPEVVHLVDRETERRAELAITALKGKGVAAEYWRGTSRFVDMCAWIAITDAAGLTEADLKAICDAVINPQLELKGRYFSCSIREQNGKPFGGTKLSW